VHVARKAAALLGATILLLASGSIAEAGRLVAERLT
jgi:hypothetical protein